MSASERYHWKRFWCRRDGRIVLDQGYVLDPEDTRGFLRNPDVVGFEEITAKPCLILLGEPGIGKSTAMRAEQEATRPRLREGEKLLCVDLGVKRDPRKHLFDDASFKAWQQGQCVLHLFIDSLDECPVRDVAHSLIGELQDGPIEKLRLRLACRTAELPHVIESELPALWKAKDDVGFYELVPLRRRDVAEAAGADEEAFLAEIARKGAESLAIKPITLRFLLNLFRKHKTLPKTRHAIYLEGCRVLCIERSDRRKDLHEDGLLSAEQHLAVAARIAAVCVFARRGIVWRKPDLGDVPDDAVLEERLRGGLERTPGGGSLEVTGEVLRETLRMTGLFSSRGPGQLGWAHQTYPEFLAAYFLEQRGLTVDQMMEVITHPGDRTKIAPELRETAAWLASMRREVFEKILETDPLVLLRSDGAMMDDVTRERLVDGLLERVERWEVRDLDLTRGPYARKLAHPELAAQLEPVIRDRSKKFITRRAAMALAEECKVTALRQVVAAVALDASADPEVRAVATHAVTVLDDDGTVVPRLMPLAFGQLGDDPNDELRGYALRALWPRFMNPAQLFGCLTKPRTPLYIGQYYRFLKQPIEQNLGVADLPTALAWVGSYPNSEPFPSLFSGLSERIMRRAWGHLDDQATLSAFVNVVRRRLDEHEPIFRKGNVTEDYGEDPGVLLAHEARRRLVVSTIIDVMAELEHEAFTLVYFGLMRVGDVAWAVQCLKYASEEVQQRRWSCLVAELWFTSGYDAQVSELVLGAACQSDALQNAIGPGFVDLDSPGAIRDKERYIRTKERMRQHEPSVLDPPPEVRVQNCLEQFERGDLDAWCQLHLEMTLEPASEHYGHEFQPELVKLPGWGRADEETRARILRASKQYLEQRDAEPEKWIGESPFYPPATAGYRGLRLLLRVDPAAVVALSRDTWRRWASIILGYPRVNGTVDEEGRHQQLIGTAYRNAPEEFLWALGILINRENETQDSISITRELMDRWDDRLGSLLLVKATDSNLKPGCLRSLLEELLQREIPGALQLALSFLRAPVPHQQPARGCASAAAEALLPRAVEVCWPALRAISIQDRSFVSDVFLGVASHMDSGSQAGAWAARLSEDDAADLYLWLAREFPPEEDRRHKFDGRLHEVQPRDTVAEMRDALLHHLAGRGTEASLAAVERLKAALPGQSRVSFASIHARETTLQQTWKPLDLEHILGLMPPPSTAQPRIEPMTSAPAHTSASTDAKPIFAWIQISDIHAGHGAREHQFDQRLVMRALFKDIALSIAEGLPAPDALLITGDVASSATKDQYDLATEWLAEAQRAEALDALRVFIVPGNHDVDWSVDQDRATQRLLGYLHDGKDDVDTVLGNESDRKTLASRFASYIRFARKCSPACYPGDDDAGSSLLGWSHRYETRDGLAVRLLGFNTALLSMRGDDRGRLRVGKEALETNLGTIREGELVIALSHHPVHTGWLADERVVRGWLESNVHVHLCGHVHDPDSENTMSGAGGHFVRITAGAVHGERQPEGIPFDHGYNFAAVVPGASPGTFAVRVWPRRFSDRTMDFREHTHRVPRNKKYAEHPLGLVAPTAK